MINAPKSTPFAHPDGYEPLTFRLTAEMNYNLRASIVVTEIIIVTTTMVVIIIVFIIVIMFQSEMNPCDGKNASNCTGGWEPFSTWFFVFHIYCLCSFCLSMQVLMMVIMMIVMMMMNAHEGDDGWWSWPFTSAPQMAPIVRPTLACSIPPTCLPMQLECLSGEHFTFVTC